MEFYIPSLLLLLIAGIVIVFFLPNLSSMVLLVLSSLLLLWAATNHYTLFADQYRNMNWANTATSAAPYLMLFLVIVLAIGYIFLLFTSSGAKSSVESPSLTIPPPNTATNLMTRGIGNSLVSSGLANVSRGNLNRSVSFDESALSKGL
jgi:hypothetical protein